MCFWPVNEMTELVSGMTAPQFGDESSLSVSIKIQAVPVFRSGVRCIRVCPGVRVPQVDDHRLTKYLPPVACESQEAIRKRRRKGNPVSGGITGPPYSWEI
jgi:hypothetical protein